MDSNEKIDVVLRPNLEIEKDDDNDIFSNKIIDFNISLLKDLLSSIDAPDMVKAKELIVSSKKSFYWIWCFRCHYFRHLP